MIALKTIVTQVSGNLSEAYLSGIMENGTHHTIRLRQDFELRIAEPLEFKDDNEAIKFLDMYNHGCKHYSTGKRIFAEYKDQPRQLYFAYEIEELN